MLNKNKKTQISSNSSSSSSNNNNNNIIYLENHLHLVNLILNDLLVWATTVISIANSMQTVSVVEAK
jgi:hypothetical protein